MVIKPMLDKRFLSIKIILTLIIIYCILSILMPAYWNWSVVSLENIKFIQIAFLISALILFFLPRLSQFIFNLLSDLLNKLISAISHLPKIVKACLWIVLPAIMLYLLRVDVHIYGDGQNLIGSIVDGQISSPIFNRIGMIMQIIAKPLGLVGGSRENAETFISIISIASGVLFFYYSWKTVNVLTGSNEKAIWSWLALITSGYIILFCGYIETYSIFVAWIMIYVYHLLLYNRKQFGITSLVVVFLTGLFWHTLFIAFLPSLIWSINCRRNIVKNRIIWLLSLIFIAGIYLFGQLIKRGEFHLTIPFLPTDYTSYYLFSPSHLIDMLNQMIIVGPALAILGLVIIFMFRGRDRNVNEKTLLWMAIPVLLLSFMIDPHMGAARDWDILSIFAVPLVLFALAFITRKNNFWGQYILIPILIFNLTHTGSSIMINKDEDKAVDRIIRISLEDPHYQNDYYEGKRNRQFAVILSNIYHRNEQALLFTQRLAYSPGAELLDIINNANMYYNSKDFEKAAYYYEKVAEKYPLPLEQRFNYARSLSFLQRHQESIELLNSMIDDTSFVDMYFSLGISYSQTGRLDSCKKYFEIGLTSFPDTLKTMTVYKEYLKSSGFYDLALEYQRRIFSVFPDSQHLRSELIDLFNRTSMYDSAGYYMGNGN
jgi:Tetratricopeptide repeat